MDRRTALGALAAAPFLACKPFEAAPSRPPPVRRGALADVVRSVEPIAGLNLRTLDPFLFCAHHRDAYPPGDGRLSPAAPLGDRDLGSDFSGRDGWSMYHGRSVPGFPQHPHRGFETVTVVRRGLVDHSDSLGATARYGNGDVQWLTAGGGIQHAEMFPLVETAQPNTLLLFQIWLNLPRADKRVDPHFRMFWAPQVPSVLVLDAAGLPTRVTTIAGRTFGQSPPAPPPHSWAARPDTDVTIATLAFAGRARFEIPAARPGTQRALYFLQGGHAKIGEREIPPRSMVVLRPEADAVVENGELASEALLLQGLPIGEPVVQRGPFAMNTEAEIREAFSDYRRTGFGGWPWPDPAPVHGIDGRFARFPDGHIERAPG